MRSTLAILTMVATTATSTLALADGSVKLVPCSVTTINLADGTSHVDEETCRQTMVDQPLSTKARWISGGFGAAFAVGAAWMGWTTGSTLLGIIGAGAASVALAPIVTGVLMAVGVAAGAYGIYAGGRLLYDAIRGKTTVRRIDFGDNVSRNEPTTSAPGTSAPGGPASGTSGVGVTR